LNHKTRSQQITTSGTPSNSSYWKPISMQVNVWKEKVSFPEA